MRSLQVQLLRHWALVIVAALLMGVGQSSARAATPTWADAESGVWVVALEEPGGGGTSGSLVGGDGAAEDQPIVNEDDELDGDPANDRPDDETPTQTIWAGALGAVFGLVVGAVAGAAAKSWKSSSSREPTRLAPGDNVVVDWRESAAQLAQALLAELDAASTSGQTRRIETALNSGRARRIEPAPGVGFDPAKHAVLETSPTDRLELDGLVSSVVRPGWELEDVVLRPAEVLVWRCSVEGGG